MILICIYCLCPILNKLNSRDIWLKDNKHMTHPMLLGALVSFGLACSISHAGVIILNSQPGLANSLTPATVAITPAPAWQQNNPVNPGDPSESSAIWISHSETGYGDSDFQPFNGQTPVVRIYHDFTSAAGFLNLKVWADDTTEVLLDGVSIFEPKFTQSLCSGQPIGCRDVDAGIISNRFGSGAHRLEFVLFQVGGGVDSKSNPFGLLYTGTAATHLPEPGTMALAGVMLLVVAGMTKRFRRMPPSQ
jgi:hypothetical protein